MKTIEDLWGEYGFGDDADDARMIYDGATGVDAATVNKATVALDMVQTFVDTFVGGTDRYVVGFDEKIVTAGTSFDARKVIINHAVLEDPDVSAREAGLVLTGLAVHECGHVRYGKDSARAARRMKRRHAEQLSNILDDVRIERSFADEYPGFADVFRPTLDYVARKGLAGRPHVEPDASDPMGIVAAAIRYDAYAKWPADLLEERDWWQAWADRWGDFADGRRHAKGLREGLDHLDAFEAEHPKPKPEPGDGEPGGDPSDGEPGEPGDEPGGDPGNGSDGESADDPSGSKGTPSKGEARDGDAPTSLPGAAGCASDQTRTENTAADLQVAVDMAKDLESAGPLMESHGRGEVLTVAQARQSGRYRSTFRPSAVTAAVAQAFMRSRSGHTGCDRRQRRGRLDGKALDRIAMGDDRLFSRRHAPNPKAHLVWIMVDCSSSMSGYPRGPIADAAEVAHAMAAASRHTVGVRMAVKGWTTSIRSALAEWSVTNVWESGQELTKVGDLTTISMGGTPDAPVLDWAIEAIRREARADETPLIVMASDGQGFPEMEAVAARGRKAGVRIVSVALGSQIDEGYQTSVYGRGNFVPWGGSIAAAARPLAQMIGRVVAGR